VPGTLVSSKWQARDGDMPDAAVAVRGLWLSPVNEKNPNITRVTPE